MDRYNERLIDGKAGIKEYFLNYFPIALIAIGIACTVFQSWGIFVVILGGFLAYMLWGSANIEWEYIIVNGETEISKITDKKKRKVVANIGLSTITAFDKSTSDKAKNDLDIKKNLIVVDYSGKNSKPEDVYAIYANDNGKNKLILLDLDEKCVEHYKLYLKQKCLFK